MPRFAREVKKKKSSPFATERPIAHEVMLNLHQKMQWNKMKMESLKGEKRVIDNETGVPALISIVLVKGGLI